MKLNNDDAREVVWYEDRQRHGGPFPAVVVLTPLGRSGPWLTAAGRWTS